MPPWVEPDDGLVEGFSSHSAEQTVPGRHSKKIEALASLYNTKGTLDPHGVLKARTRAPPLPEIGSSIAKSSKRPPHSRSMPELGRTDVASQQLPTEHGRELLQPLKPPALPKRLAALPPGPLGAQFDASPVRFDGTGYLEADFSKNGFYESGVIVEPIARDDDVRLAIKMPWVVRGGLAFRPNENLELELSGTWENWSNFEEIVLTDIDMTVDVDNTNPLFPEDPSITDDVTLPSTYQDSYSVRLGGEYRVNDRLDVRAGAMYESSAVPPEIMAVDLVDGPKYGGGVGVTPHLGPVDVDLAFFALKVQDQQISDSQVHQIQVDVLSAEVEEGDVVGNGTFESLIWMPSVGLAYHFGR